MIRVLHYIGGLGLGGAQSAVIEIYRNIDRTKIQFDFVIHDLNDNNYNDELNALGAKIFVCPKFNGKNLKQYYKWWDYFFKEHSEYKILHSHIRGSATICLKIAKSYGVKTIIHSHSTSNGVGVSALVKKVMQFPLRYQADYFFACSIEAGKWLFGEKIVKSNNFFVVKNGIDMSRFYFNVEKRKEIRKQLGIDENTFVIGHVGRFIEAKNHEFLIELFAAINDKNKDTKLLLIGDGKLRKSIENKCIKMSLQDNVIFLGALANTEDYYNAMDVFCFPSLWEGLGIVAIEAQTSGLNCVVSNQVPNETDLGMDLITKISLNSGIPNWVSNILKYKKHKKRKVDQEKIMKSEYNIINISSKIQRFYLSIVR